MDLTTLPVKQTADASLQNKINISIIFHYLREKGPAYRAQISKDLKISAPAVSRAVENLKSHGYVIETEKQKTKSGRNAVQILVSPDFGYVIGIDLIKEHVRFGLFNFNGTMIEEYEGFSFTERIDVENKLAAGIDLILKKLKSISPGPDTPKLKAISIGVPASVDITSGNITAILYDSLEGLNISKMLSKRFNVPVFSENITNLSALAEHTYGQGKKYRNLVFVEVSRGIGAGIIIENKLVRGATGSAGEIGSIISGHENLGFCQINNKGYLEHLASVDSIGERAAERIGSHSDSLIIQMAGNDQKKINPSIVCKAAMAGDKFAREIICDVVRLLSLGITNLVLVLNPEIVVLGGDICHLPGLKELIIAPLTALVEKAVPIAMPSIIVSSLGEDAGIIGASHRAIESLLIGKYPFKIEQE
jgi:N-acetylglucosamine repressor